MDKKVVLPNTKGADLTSDLKVVSKNIFIKNKMNCLTSDDFVGFIKINEIGEFYLIGADATICVKSTCFNLCKLGYKVTVISDCIASWNMKQIPEMLQYYEKQGAKIISVNDLIEQACRSGCRILS